jgi:hypothetical protein
MQIGSPSQGCLASKTQTKKRLCISVYFRHKDHVPNLGHQYGQLLEAADHTESAFRLRSPHRLYYYRDLYW